MNTLRPLLRALDYSFNDAALLQRALTHRSHSGRHNERLEFLGDGILNFVVAALLYERFDTLDEGDLSRLRANLVKQSALAEIAQRLELSRYLRLGEGELKSGGFRRPSILSDTLEAIFGAVYLDGGFAEAFRVIAAQYQEILTQIDPHTLGKDPKTLLQEILQARRLDLPVYTVINVRGAAHDQLFEVQCRIEQLDIVVSATGPSRRAAEQGAASQAIQALHACLPDKRRAHTKGRARMARKQSSTTSTQEIAANQSRDKT